MKYVLVSLLGDEATAANDAFARWFAGSHAPAAAFHAEHPEHADVAAAVRATPNALVLGHDGDGSVRGAARGAPWAEPEAFAEMFAGARVWVYACDTRGATLEADLFSFGKRAHERGVGVFAGHSSPITAVPGFPSIPYLRDAVYEALARAFRAFIQGENSAEALRRAALKSRGRATALAANPIERDMRNLRVLA